MGATISIRKRARGIPALTLLAKRRHRFTAVPQPVHGWGTSRFTIKYQICEGWKTTNDIITSKGQEQEQSRDTLIKGAPPNRVGPVHTSLPHKQSLIGTETPRGRAAQIIACGSGHNREQRHYAHCRHTYKHTRGGRGGLRLADSITIPAQSPWCVWASVS